MKNIFIFGYYGFQNTGDEAILKVMLDQVRENIPYANITVLSYKAKETAEKYNVKAISRNQYRDLIKAIKSSDIVVSGGGSILQDTTSARSLFYYLSIIYMAKKMGKKVMFYGNGFGPIIQPLNQKIVKKIVNQVDVITVRDEESKAEMKALGIERDIVVTADVTFAYKELGENCVDHILAYEEIDLHKKKIGISLRYWKDEENYKQRMATLGDYLLDRGFEVILIPMQCPSDYIVLQEIMGIMKGNPKILSKGYSPRDIIGVMSHLDLVIGMRLHALIFSTIAGVPSIGIEYDAKISNFINLVNQENGGKVESLDEEYLIAAVHRVMENYEEYKVKVENSRRILRQKSVKNIEILKNFMDGGITHEK